MTGFETFCGGSPFWDLDLLLNSSYPKFTQCFQDTALVWGPCGALWVVTPLYLWYMSQQRCVRQLSVTGHNIAKSFVAALILTVCITELIRRLLSDDDQPTVKVVSAGVQVATFALVLFIIYQERRFGFLTSGVLFIVTLLLVVAGIVPLYTKIIEKEYETDEVGFAVYCAYFGLLTVEFLIFCVAEKVSQTGYQNPSYQNFSSRPECPEVTASFPSQVFFLWITKLLKRGYRAALSEDQVFSLNPRDQHQNVIPEFEQCWDREKRKCAAFNRSQRQSSMYTVYKNTERAKVYRETTPLVEDPKKQKVRHPALGKTILKVFGGSILISQFLKLLSDLLTFVTPLLINELISFTQHRETQQEWKGFVLAFSFFLVAMLKTCIYQYHFHVSMVLGMRIKSAVISSVYKKALTISVEAKKENTVGEIVNLMSVDCQRIQDATGFIYMVWSMPLMIVISMYMLWGVLGPSCLAGLAVLLALLPINVWCSYRQRAYQMLLMKTKDQRLKIMNEVLNGMKVLKLYAWEESFQQKISDIRQTELTTLKKTAYLVATTLFIFTCAPYVVQLVSFAVYIATSSSGYLDPSTAFVSISLFGILRMPMSALPMVIPFMIQANVSIGRVSKFLRSEDLDPNVVKKDPGSDSAISIDNGTFTWDQEMALPTLRNITLGIKPGSLVAVVGTVGSGKSSLLSAMLGEMKKLSGKVTVRDSIAYVPQEAWIQNATVRDNILFGTGYSASNYQRVLDACSLQSDLDILPAKDETEIGEKGINLSGGQKQRVSLARAVYSDADTYLLDDPLSAVDSHVGKHIFKEVIGHSGLLKHKTRVLVTHGIHWLPMVDYILVLENGVVTEAGSYEDLMTHEGSFATFLKEFFIKEVHSEAEDGTSDDPEVQSTKRLMLERLESITSDDESGGNQEHVASLKRQLSRQHSLVKDDSFKKAEKPEKKEDIAGKKLIEEEKQETGNVKTAVYLAYVRAVGLCTFLVLTFIYVFFQASVTFSSIWLSMWTDDSLLGNASAAGSPAFVDKNNMYLAVYGVLGCVQGGFILIFALIATTQMVRAAGSLHLDLLHNVLRSPMSFFDTTPIGRIINRFSRDVETVDNNLPSTIRSFYGCVFNVTGTFIVISYSTPIFVAVIVPIGILYWLIQRFYIPTSRQLKRIESTTRSPIYVHFAETVSGAASIRAYDVSERFIQESKHRVDHNLSFYFANLVSNRFLGWGLEFIGNLVILASAMFAVTTTNLEAGLVGLSVSYASQVTGALNYLVRNFSDLETNIVSVERLQEYTKTPTESAWVYPRRRPGPTWPTEGCVEFADYQTRYRPGLDLVLRGVNCHIKAGEKVGIVGRTGAGKSSLTVALFRLIEPVGGRIVIDGISIADIGLHDLRKKLTILPQDPVIFSGTMRMNLDPFDQHTDATLWTAVENAHMKKFVESLPGRLDYECGEGGQNLSVGQRQLLCLARTLIRKTKILVLDEATAAVDMETDDLIQQTIRSEFQDCTILTIAHRLNTILDYDKIMVLDHGRVKEFDSPAALLENKHSIFHGLAKDAGLV